MNDPQLGGQSLVGHNDPSIWPLPNVVFQWAVLNYDGSPAQYGWGWDVVFRVPATVINNEKGLFLFPHKKPYGDGWEHKLLLKESDVLFWEGNILYESPIKLITGFVVFDLTQLYQANIVQWIPEGRSK